MRGDGSTMAGENRRGTMTGREGEGDRERERDKEREREREREC